MNPLPFTKNTNLSMFQDIDIMNGKIDQLDNLTDLLKGLGPNPIEFLASPNSPKSPGAPNTNSSSSGNKNSSAKNTNKTENDSEKSIIKEPRVNSSQGNKAMNIALQEVGVKEVPAGSNKGPRVDQYQGGTKGQYWCSHFVSWCFEQTGGSPFGHIASVSRLRKWGKSNGKYIPVDTAAPAPGDIFTKARYDDVGKLVGGHTGFVTGYNAKNKTVATVEGNTGDAVKERNRSISSLDGFIRC